MKLLKSSWPTVRSMRSRNWLASVACQLKSARGLGKVKLREGMPRARMVEYSTRAPACSDQSGAIFQLDCTKASPRFSLTSGLAPGSTIEAPFETKLELPLRKL